MSIETKSSHITPVGGNVFADLGFEPEEAARLLAETDAIISDKLAQRDAVSRMQAAPRFFSQEEWNALAS